MPPSPEPPSKAGPPRGGLAGLVVRLVEPNPAVTSAAARQRARLCSSILVALIPLDFLMVTVYAVADYRTRQPFNDPGDIIGALSLLMLVLAYSRARSPRPHQGSVLTVATASVALWLSWIVSLPDGATVLYFIAVPIAISALLLDFGRAVAVIASNVAAVIILDPGSDLLMHVTPDWLEDVTLMSFLTLVAAVSIVSAFVMQRDARQLEQQTNELSRVNERLREVDRERLQFVNTVAHDLASPLTPIQVQLHLLQSPQLLPADASKKSLEIITRSMQRVNRLVGDLKDVAKFEAGQLKMLRQNVDLAALARAVYDELAPAADAKKVRFDLQSPSTLPAVADGQRLTQVWVNLVGNALKFTPSGGRVVLRLEETVDGIASYVTDTGRGMTAEERAKLFKPFSQIHREGEASEKGTGLGLFISKSIVEAHGGRIGVFSDGYGKGSSFWLFLPRTTPEPGRR